MWNAQPPRYLSTFEAFKPRSPPHDTMDVEQVLAGKYPAKSHAKRVVEWMRSQNTKINGVLYLEGQKTRMIEDNDGEMHFRYDPFPSIENGQLILRFSQTTKVFLLSHWLQSARCLLRIRYCDRDLNSLYSSHRARKCTLVRSASIRR